MWDRLRAHLLGSTLIFLLSPPTSLLACDYLWQIGHPLPTAGLITTLAFGNGTYVGVSPEGDVATSLDGLQWTRQASPAPEGFHEIVFGNHLFIATSGQGASYRLHESPDGIRWRSLSLSTQQQTIAFSRVIFAGDHFFGLMGRSLYSSPDGRSWTLVLEASGDFVDVAWGQGTYVALVYGMNYLTSPDGLTWTGRTLPYPGPFVRILYGAGKFVALGYGTGTTLILTSADAETWAIAHYMATVGPDGLARFGGGHFVLFSDWHGMYSPDGEHWTNFEVEPHSIKDVQWGDGKFLAFDIDRRLLASTDGLFWEAVTEPGFSFKPWVTSLTYSDSLGMFVAVGSHGLVATSLDGVQWNWRLLDPLLGLTGIASGGGRLVAVGVEGVLLTSEDGEVWQDLSPSTTFSFGAVAHGSGVFVAAGENGVMYTSPDGLSWTQRDSGFRGTITGLAYGSGRFVAVGDSETLLYSSDGLSWSGSENPLSGIRFNAVAYGNGLFAVTNSLGDLLISTDGQNWQVVPDVKYVVRLAFAGGQFYGWSQTTTLTSQDGVHWTAVAPGLGPFGLPASDGNILVAVRNSEGREPAFLWARTCLPEVASVDRDTLPVEGGIPLQITGSHLSEATDVRFGDVPSPQYAVLSDNLIAAVAPAQPEGVVAISVTTPGGTSLPTGAATVVVGTRPEIQSIKKLSSPFRLKIQGTGFNGSSTVLINGRPAPSTALKKNGTLLAGGGNFLKSMLPKGQTAQIVVLNGDTGIPSHPFAFTP